MNEIELTESTGNTIVDQTVRAVVGIFELAFAQRMRSYYVEGSFADGSDIDTSDLDLTIVVKDGFVDDAEREAARQLATYCAALSKRELDILFMADTDIDSGVYPSVKASLHVYGEDQRDQMQVYPIERWTRERMHAAYGLLTHVFRRPTPVQYPVTFPDSDDAFRGYTQRQVQLASGDYVNSTRDLIRVTGWIATALLAHQAQVYVARKSDCHRLYREHIGDQWADLIEDIYTLCRTRWNYLVPEAPADQAALRALCDQTLRFENHFLAIYKSYLLDQLRSDDDVARQHALRVLQFVPMDDVEIKRAVQEPLAS